MHETAIVAELIRIIETHASRHHATRVIRVRLKIGCLRAVEPAQLCSCFEMFAAGTVAEGAELVIDMLGVRGRCRACATEFDVQRYLFECPACSGSDIEVTQGHELYVESFEADSPVESGFLPPNSS